MSTATRKKSHNKVRPAQINCNILQHKVIYYTITTVLHRHAHTNTDAHTHTHSHILRLSWILSQHQKGKNRKVKQSGFTGARDSEWQWHQLGHMQICTLTQTHNHASIPPLSFLQAGCPS